jgi:hypothetical protein
MPISSYVSPLFSLGEAAVEAADEQASLAAQACLQREKATMGILAHCHSPLVEGFRMVPSSTVAVVAVVGWKVQMKG